LAAKGKNMPDSERPKEGAYGFTPSQKAAGKKLVETKATLANPFYGFNTALSQQPKENAEYRSRKYKG
jgi:hypothetical protein